MTIMIDISAHPVWKCVHPFKKTGHLLRIKLARQYGKLHNSSKFIGVTGSVGKTTTVIACLAVASTKFKTISTQARLDAIFNLPISLLKTSFSTEKVVLEMGVEYPGEMEFYLSLIKPKTVIVTKIANAHSEFLGDIDEIAREKGQLVESVNPDGVVILNYDDLPTRKLAQKTKAKVIFFGTDPQNCDVWANRLRNEDFQLVFGLNYGVESVEVRSKLLGMHSVYSLLAAAALGLSLDIPLTKIKKALESVEPPEHRLQAIPGYNGCIVLDDTYNAAPVSVEQALETLSRLSARRRILVLGEMRELGPFSEKLHRRIAQKIFQEKPDLVFLGTGDTKYIADELLKLGFIPERMESNLKNPEIVSKLFKILSKGDVVLVKGARSVRLDEVAERLTKLNEVKK